MDKKVIKHGLKKINGIGNTQIDEDVDMDDEDGDPEMNITKVIEQYLSDRGVNPKIAELRAQRLVSKLFYFHFLFLQNFF